MMRFVCKAALLIALASLSFQITAKTIYQIGIAPWTGYEENVSGFKHAMEKAGLKEGENVVYTLKKSNGDQEVQQRIAKELADSDLIYSLTTTGTSIIKEHTPEETPIVFSIVTYPADAGLIESFDYSGNNLVGTSNYVSIHSYVNLLTTLLPETKTLAIFHRKGEPNSKIQASNVIRLMEASGIKVIDLEPTSVNEMAQMAKEVVSEVDVFMTTTDTLCQGGGEAALLPISLANNIPILSSNKAQIEEGSTFGPVADFYTLGVMAGELAAKILKENKKPAQLESKLMDPPVILLHKKNAQRLGIAVDPTLLPNIKFVE